MQVVIDSVSVQHLLRALKPSKTVRQCGSDSLVTSLDKPLKQRKLELALDIRGGLQTEWGQTCGTETIKVLITRWDDFGALQLIEPTSSIGFPHSKQLTQLRFTDTIDRLILRIALATVDRKVVSDDPDFWDPRQTGQKGNPSAPVATFCQNSLGIEVMLLATLLHRV